MARAFFDEVLLSPTSMGSDITPATGLEMSASTLAYVQAVFTGTPTGVLQLATSSDNVHWDVYPNSSVNLTGSAGSQSWHIAETGFPYIQVQYVFTSGSGSLRATFCGKRDGSV